MVFSRSFLKLDAKLALFFEITQYYFDKLAYFPQIILLKNLKSSEKQKKYQKLSTKYNPFIKKSITFAKSNDKYQNN